jgi:hypothetical protein
MSTTRNLAILIFEDVEVLDFCGPFEVFSVASRFTDPPAFNVLTVAEKPGPVLTRGGLSVNPHHRLLGIFKPQEEKAKKAREKEEGERFLIEVLGRPVPATNTDDGIRAVRGGKPIDPDSVRRYLDSKFGENLKAVRSAMQKLAKAYRPKELARDAYRLYEQFRPAIPEGVRDGVTRAIWTWR